MYYENVVAYSHLEIQNTKVYHFFFWKNHKVHLLFQTLNNICISPLKSIIFNRCVDNKSAVDIHFIIRKYSLCFSEIHKRVLSSFSSYFLMNRVLSSSRKSSCALAHLYILWIRQENKTTIRCLMGKPISRALLPRSFVIHNSQGW